jgi:hypothetical protein
MISYRDLEQADVISTRPNTKAQRRPKNIDQLGYYLF